MRVIAGIYGGRLLDAPDNSRTHPMSERMRNAMFNSIGDEIKGARVLDAFAGTGSVGIEALSRGAASATFVERDRIAQKIIDNNFTTLGLGSEAKLVRAPVSGWIDTYDGEFFDIIFADPPYNNVQLSTVWKLKSLLKPNGLMVLSNPGRCEAPTNLGIVVVDNRSYGNACLTYFRLDTP